MRIQISFLHPLIIPMISGEIRRYLRDNSAIRVSRSLRDIAYKAIYAKEAIMKSMTFFS